MGKINYIHELDAVFEMILVPCKVSLVFFYFYLDFFFFHLNQCGHIYRHVSRLPVMINWLWKYQYRPELLKNAADEIHGEWETCKNLSEIQWPSHLQITHAMWQESIYTDECLKGKEKNVWKYHLKAAVVRVLIAIFKNMQEKIYRLFGVRPNFPAEELLDFLRIISGNEITEGVLNIAHP